MSVQLIEQTFRLGKQVWKLSNGEWFVQTWGWGNFQSLQDGQPRYSWIAVQDERVPKELKGQALAQEGRKP